MNTRQPVERALSLDSKRNLNRRRVSRDNKRKLLNIPLEEEVLAYERTRADGKSAEE